MSCSFQSHRDAMGFHCSLGHYGGRPHALACVECMERGENHATQSAPLIAATRAAMKWARAGFSLASETAVAVRLAACTACPQWEPKAYSGLGRCAICRCATQAKLRLATETCPLGKW